MALYLVQHGLVDRHSHYFDETLSWREAVADSGLDWHCYANIKLPPDISQRTGATPAFRFTTDADLETDRRFGRLADFIDIAESFAADCDRALRKRVRRGDLVLIPYAGEQEIFGAAMWIERLRRSVRPRLAFIIHRPDFRWSFGPDRNGFEGDMNYWRYAGKRLALATQDQPPFIGGCDQRLSRLLTNMLRMEVRPVPMATFGRDLPIDPAQVPRTYDLGMVGNFRSERGGLLIADILAPLAAKNRQRRFLLQVATDSDRDAALASFAQAGASGAVDVVVGNVTTEQFFRNVAACRLLVLPYAPGRYRMRPSGILGVATALWVPVIVPGETWMSDRIADGSATGFVYDDLTTAALEAVLSQPQHDREAMQRQAVARAEPWRRQNAAHMLLGQILAFHREQTTRA